MAVKFVNVDLDTPMMFPPDLREWLPEDSMVHFVVDAVKDAGGGVLRGERPLAATVRSMRSRQILNLHF